MSRLTELHGSAARHATTQIFPQTLDSAVLIERAQRQRAAFMAAHLRRGVSALGRWTGLSRLSEALRQRLRRRRTLHALAALDDRLLSDIGVSRDSIETIASDCCGETASPDNSPWVALSTWAGREVRRLRTQRTLSAMTDELLADIGVERGDIPAIAAALADAPQTATAAAQSGTAVGIAPVPLSAQVLDLAAARRSLRRAGNTCQGESVAA